MLISLPKLDLLFTYPAVEFQRVYGLFDNRVYFSPAVLGFTYFALILDRNAFCAYHVITLFTINRIPKNALTHITTVRRPDYIPAYLVNCYKGRGCFDFTNELLYSTLQLLNH